MKNVIFILGIAILLSSFNVLNSQTISIKNKNKFSYDEKVIELPFQKIKVIYKWLKEENFKVINVSTRQEIPFQLEYKGFKSPVNLLIQLSISKKEKVELLFLQEKPSQFKTKTFGRYVPERADDFAWENDKIAFRTYGKALELTPKKNAYGIDVWVKRTDKMVVNERYKRRKYHVDNGDGMDYYHVGYTLGAGNCAPFVNDSIWYSKNYTKYEILDNGPLRTAFRLYFDEWNVSGHLVTATKTISLDAGAQLNKIEVNYSCNTLKNMPLVVGIIKRDGIGKELFDTKNGLLGYWEPTDTKNGTTGVGVVIPLKVNDIKLRKDQYLAFLNAPINKAFSYYTGAAWNRAGNFTNAKEWFEYLQNYRNQLQVDGLEISY